MAASSFGSTNIRVELDAQAGSTPWWTRPSYVTTRHIPGSDDDVVQVMGAGYGTAPLRLLLSPSEWTAFAAQLLTEDTLTIGGVDYGTCLLQAIDSVQREVDGYMTVQATFQRTASGA